MEALGAVLVELASCRLVAAAAVVVGELTRLLRRFKVVVAEGGLIPLLRLYRVAVAAAEELILLLRPYGAAAACQVAVADSSARRSEYRHLVLAARCRLFSGSSLTRLARAVALSARPHGGRHPRRAA